MAAGARDAMVLVAATDLQPLANLTSTLAQLTVRGVRPSLLPALPTASVSTSFEFSNPWASPSVAVAVATRSWPLLVPGPAGDAVRLLAQSAGVVELLCDVMGAMDAILDRTWHSGASVDRTSASASASRKPPALSPFNQPHSTVTSYMLRHTHLTPGAVGSRKLAPTTYYEPAVVEAVQAVRLNTMVGAWGDQDPVLCRVMIDVCNRV